MLTSLFKPLKREQHRVECYNGEQNHKLDDQDQIMMEETTIAATMMMMMMMMIIVVMKMIATVIFSMFNKEMLTIWMMIGQILLDTKMKVNRLRLFQARL